MTAKSSRCRRMRSASAADSGLDELVAERLEDRLERQQVLRPVVDEQKRGRGHHGRHLREAAQLDEQRTRSRRPARRSPAARGRAPHAASRRARPSSGSWTTAAPPSSATRARPRAPSAFAPVRTTPDAPLTVCLRGRLEENVDRGARVLHRLVDRQRERRRARRAGGSRAPRCRRSRAQLVLVAGFAHLQAGGGAEQVAEGGRVRLGRAVLGDHDGGVELGRQAAQDGAHGVEPAPGGADRNEVVAHRIRR